MKAASIFIIFLITLSVGCKKDNPGEEGEPAPGSSVTIENKIYKTIVVGNLEWTSENYDGIFGVYYNGEVNHSSGKLLSLYDTRNLAKQLPAGWRIPTVKDYVNLINRFGGFIKYNSTGTVDDKIVDEEIKPEALLALISNAGWAAAGNNKSGFNLLPAGYSAHTSSFDYKGEATALWTTDIYFNVYHTPMLLGIFGEVGFIEGGFAEYAQAIGKVTDDSRGKGSVRLVRDR